jgi:hypothetical protein
LPRGYSFSLERDDLFAQLQAVPVGTAQVPTLSNEATLLFLLLHGMKHDWLSLGWVCDTAELLRCQAVDWKAVLDWSHAKGRRRPVDIGLSLAHVLLRAPVPEWVLQRGRADARVAHTVDALITQLFCPAENVSLYQRTLGLHYFRSMERVGDRLRYLHDVVLRPTSFEWRAVPLPHSLSRLYYLVRPARLLWKYGARRRASVPKG